MNGGASRASDGQVEDEGDNIVGALAVMASRPPSSKTAEATKEDRNNEQTRGTERPTCLAHEAGTAQTSAPHNVDLLRQRAARWSRIMAATHVAGPTQ